MITTAETDVSLPPIEVDTDHDRVELALSEHEVAQIILRACETETDLILSLLSVISVKRAQWRFDARNVAGIIARRHPELGMWHVSTDDAEVIAEQIAAAVDRIEGDPAEQTAGVPETTPEWRGPGHPAPMSEHDPDGTGDGLVPALWAARKANA